MAKFIRYLAVLSFQVFYFRALVADTISSFSVKNFGPGSNFASQIALYGDAKVVNGGSSLQITGSSIRSAGKVVCKRPIKLVEGNPKKMVSFSTNFSFSLSPEKGDGLAFVMVPAGFPLNVFDDGSFGLLGDGKMKFLGVEFDTLMDEKYDDMNGNHVGVDVSSLVSVKVFNASSINLVLNSGGKMQVWVDYEAGSKRLEVRLSKLGDVRPLAPLLSCPIDLSLFWKEQEVIVGLSSSSRNSSQRCDLYSWSFSSRTVPQWMHSEPFDPQSFQEKIKDQSVRKKRDCALKVLAAIILGTGSGALGAVIVLFLWNTFGNRRPVAPEEYPIHAGELEHKKFEVVVDKAIEDGKN